MLTAAKNLTHCCETLQGCKDSYNSCQALWPW